MRGNALRRDELGRILSVNEDLYNEYFEQESYVDHKEADVVFPSHVKDYNSDVKVYHISELRLHETNKNK